MSQPVPLGRVTQTVGPDGRTTWTLGAADSATQWLVWLGKQGVGGFIQVPVPPSAAADAPVSIVRCLGPSLAQTSPQAVPWRHAVRVTMEVCGAAQASLARDLDPGLIEPATLHPTLDPAEGGDTEADAGLVIAACAVLHQLIGAHPPALPHTGCWRPPEATSHASPSESEHCYALGRLVYRLIAADEPFADSGHHRGEAAPFRPDVAATLPPGLQSVVLALIATAPGQRVHSFDDLLGKLAATVHSGDVAEPAGPLGAETRFAGTSFGLPTGYASPAAGPPSASSDAKVRRVRVAPEASALAPKPHRTWLRATAVVAVSALVGWGASEVAAPSSTKTVAAIGALTPLVSGQTTNSDCAHCHSVQAMQWRRSVMGESARSPLYQALEMAIEEQVAKSTTCPNGAGVLRQPDRTEACLTGDDKPLVGIGGPDWCVNCHSPHATQQPSQTQWNAMAEGHPSRTPTGSRLSESAQEGIDCLFCHQVSRSVNADDLANGGYVGNENWGPLSGDEPIAMRPETAEGRYGIANSGYHMDPDSFFGAMGPKPGMPHLATTPEVKAYRGSSEFCGTCHDVRLFGADAIAAERGEQFKRLRNAYSEWKLWSDDKAQAGESAASCQDCHMSTFPGVCVADGEAPPASATALIRACPEGLHFEAREPGSYAQGPSSNASADVQITSHYFTGVDVPLSPAYPDNFLDNAAVDDDGLPVGALARRDMLLGAVFEFEVDAPTRKGTKVEIPIAITNKGAGHRVPAGFSQEREFWVHLVVTDARGKVLYEVGKVERGEEDLHDKVFLKVNVDDTNVDDKGQPLGVFGADIADGPDVPQWSPRSDGVATKFRGKGLINLQNGFLRCVRCIGRIDKTGACRPSSRAQTRHRALRYADGNYNLETGACESNLEGYNRFFEVYFPIGGLDSTRGVVRGPDAIIDTHSAPPGVRLVYTYDLTMAEGTKLPLQVEARLLFRAFPPFLIRGFVDYEATMDARGLRPDGPLVTAAALERLEVVELHRQTVSIR